VGIVKRELKLLRHEFICLREDVALARALHDLHSEVVEARKQVPKLPAIVAGFDARQADLEAEQAHLERELAKVKDRVGKVRVDQSIANYNLAQLQKQTQASGEASIEMEFESRSAHFQMKATHPDAARALKDFATGIINGQKDGTLWLPGPAGNA
jgi:chromosome segregation ATPase